jgi:hypothetical protein
LEPTTEQRRILESSTGSITLVQFLSVQEQAAFDQYRAASEAAVRENGGYRAYGVHIDQVLAGGEMPFQELVVDMFPSGEAALIAFDTAKETRATAVAEAYILAVRPAGGPSGLVRRLRFLAPLLRPILGTDSEKERQELKGKLNPDTGPVPETIEVLRRHDQTTPFYMMNLNRYYARAQYEGDRAGKRTGEQAYARYAIRIVPYLISVGGYPDFMGHVIGTFVGSEDSPLHDDWSEFAMVYYPSRRVFLNMATHAPVKGIHHRDAGLARAVLMPSTAWPSWKSSVALGLAGE